MRLPPAALLALAVLAACAADKIYPVGTVDCADSGPCQVEKELCCVDTAQPNPLTCSSTKFATLAEPACKNGSLWFQCVSPANCAGNACCMDPKNHARCASGEACQFLDDPLCGEPADCPTPTPYCCQLDRQFSSVSYHYGICASLDISSAIYRCALPCGTSGQPCCLGGACGAGKCAKGNICQ